MISCERAWELLSLQLDGALSQQEEQELEEHLEHCPACRKEREELTRMNQALRGLGEMEAPADFTRRVMDQVRTESQEKPKVVPLHRRTQVRALAGLAACALLCIGIYRLIPQQSAPSDGMVTASQGTVSVQQPDSSDRSASQGETPSSSESDPDITQQNHDQSTAAVPRTAALPPAISDENQAQGAQSVPETESGSVPEEQPQSKEAQTPYVVTASAQTELVVSSLSEAARALLPAQEDWSTDDQGRLSCTISSQVLKELCQVLDGEGTAYTVTPQPWSETCIVRLG